MMKLLYIFSFICLTSNFVFSLDTLKHKTPEVKITAKRDSDSPASKYTSSTILNINKMNLLPGAGISDILNYIPGLNVRNYGGIGSMKTISIRGTNAQQNVIMLNGMRLNSAQNYSFDLSSLPRSFFGGIEIIKGGMSAEYGGNAIGGAINLIPDVSSSALKFSYGSFNEIYSSAQIPFAVDSFNLISNIEYTHCDGNFPFESEKTGQTTTQNRDNSDFTSFIAACNMTKKQNNSLFNTLIIARANEKGTPGAVVKNNVLTCNARLKEKEMLLQTAYNNSLTEKQRLSFGLLAKFNETDYNDPDAISSDNKGQKTKFINRDLHFNAKYLYSYSLFNSNIILDYDYNDLKGNNFSLEDGKMITRSSLGIGANFETVPAKIYFANTSVYFGVRADFIENVGNAASFMLGNIYAFTSIPLEIKLNLSTNFRPPSFNEMYYFNYGNRNLKSEKSTSTNIAIQYNFAEYLNIEAGIFVISTDDLIISVPKSPVEWTAQNLAKVLNRGIELDLNGQMFDNSISYNFSYTYQKATDQADNSPTKGKYIVYIPQEMFSAFLNYKLWNFNFGISGVYTGFKYTLSDNKPDNIITSNFILNGVINYRIKLTDNNSFNIKFDCSNIFNEQYSTIFNYPMPGINFRLGLTYVW